jgi:hypothetical protein
MQAIISAYSKLHASNKWRKIARIKQISKIDSDFFLKFKIPMSKKKCTLQRYFNIFIAFYASLHSNSKGIHIQTMR